MVMALYQGETISTAWVGDPDEDTALVPFIVERGPPVHLVITALAENIYRFSGATGRIRRVTVMGYSPFAVEGLPRDRIEFVPTCLAFNQFTGDDAVGGPAAVRRTFGRDAVNILYEGGPYRIHIGRTLRTDPLPQPVMTGVFAIDDMNRQMQGGVARVNPRRLVSEHPTGPYQTLPRSAGIRQLLRNGALVPATEEDARRWQEAAARQGGAYARTRPYYSSRAYRVTRPIIVPSGLCGANSVFLYAAARGFVRGNLCHSTIYFDDGITNRPD